MYDKEKIKIVIADDHSIYREGLKMIIDRQLNANLLGVAANGEQLVKLCHNLQPDVVITDIKMPIKDGIVATKELISKYPTMGVIALSMFDEDDLILEMLNAGARGYLLKNADKEQIIEAIDVVFSGYNYYCKQTSAKLAIMIAKNKHRKPNHEMEVFFTDREIEIIRLICREMTNKQIGDKLFISARTVEGYRAKILEKIHVKNSIGIAIYAMQKGIVEF